MKLNTRVLTNAGLLVAMSIVLTRFASLMLAGNTIRISLGTIPIYLAGLLFGPLVGGLVGGTADMAGYLFNSFGAAFIPQIFLASVMRGVIPPLVIRAVGNNGNRHVKLLTAIVCAELVSGAGLTTWGLAWMQQLSFFVVLPPRIIALLVQIPIYTMATYVLMVALRSSRAVTQQVGR